MRHALFAILLTVLVAGCGRDAKTFTDADLTRGRQALTTALDAWKAGEKLDSLRSRPEPIEFTEEWPKAGYKLLDYQIQGTEHTDATSMRYTVTLTVQDRKGKKEERKVTYVVALKSPIAIGRDPMF